MNLIHKNDPKKSSALFGLQEEFDFLIDLLNTNKLPKILMLSGKKGSGKFTLINHFLNYIFDKKNYDEKNNLINENTSFYNQYLNNVFQNIIYLSGNNFKNLKIEDVRNLKKIILKTALSNEKRFIIFDDIELFNKNCLNALLKIIEEPPINNYFILINNKTKPLIETIYSRSLEIKISLTNQKRVNIINSLIKDRNLDVFIDFNLIHLTPGNFLSFNTICKEHNFDFNENFLSNLEKLFTLYKKNKDINLINLSLFLTDYYFEKIKEKENIDKIYENKFFILKNINKFITFNINQNSLLNAINNKLLNG